MSIYQVTLICGLGNMRLRYDKIQNILIKKESLKKGI
jgi:hypothetical protein